MNVVGTNVGAPWEQCNVVHRNCCEQATQLEWNNKNTQFLKLARNLRPLSLLLAFFKACDMRF
jgi:hypothetical protein